MVSETVGLRRWLGLVLGLAGAGLVIYARARIEVTSAIGLCLACAGLVCMTLATLLEKRFALSVHPISANLIQYAVGIAVLLPLAYWREPMHVDWTPEFLAALGYLVIGNSLVIGTKQATKIENFKQNIAALDSPVLRGIGDSAQNVREVKSSFVVWTDDLAPVEEVVHRILINFILTGQ